MRRFFSLLMCVSGMSLAVTASQADEPTAPPTAERTARPIGVPHAETATAEAAEAPAPTDWATESRDRFHKLRDRLQSLYRLEIGDDELASRIEKLARQAQGLYGESLSIAEKLSGDGLEQARTNINDRFARLEKSLEEAEARSRDSGESETAERAAAVDRAESRAGRLARSLSRGTLSDSQRAELIAMIRELQESAANEAQSARVTVEGQIDAIERVLADRRERRDAQRDEARSDQHHSEPVARLRHLNAAVEHLEEAGLREIARDVKEHARELQREIMMQTQREQQRRSAAAVAEQPAADEERRQLSEQVRELRGEVRRLRDEMEQLRKEQPRPGEPLPDEAR